MEDFNTFSFHLKHLRMRHIFVGGILDRLNDEMDKSVEAIEKTKHFSDEELRDLIVDHECSVIEDIYGLAFLVTQTGIAGLVSDVLALNQFIRSVMNSTVITNEKQAIIKSDNPKVLNTEHTQIETIDALANYYKHKNEWNTGWGKIKNSLQKRTVDIIQAIGLQQGSSGNLRTGAGALEVESCGDLSIILQKWEAALGEKYEVLGKKIGLL